MKRAALTITLVFCTGIAVIPANCAETPKDLVVSDRDCEMFRPYEQDPSVQYKAGVDSHGATVAPADLGGGLQVSPDVSFPVTVDIRPWTNLNAQTPQGNGSNPPPYQLGTGTEASVGTVSVHDGQVFFNGERLSSPYENAVAQACANYLKHGKNAHRDHHRDGDRDSSGHD